VITSDHGNTHSGFISIHQRTCSRCCKEIVKRLNITGPVNIQFVAKGTDVMCIECNVRASRSFPFVSKTMGVDYIEAATKAIMGHPTEDMNLPTIETTDRPRGYIGVKCPMFSFTRLRGSDPVLGVEMASTGEVACFGETKEEAFLKFLLSTNFKILNKIVMLSVQESLQEDVTHCAYQLHELGHPAVISDFIEGAVEIEMDGVGKNGELIAAAIHEHIENAGVHSGDATLVLLLRHASINCHIGQTLTFAS